MARLVTAAPAVDMSADVGMERMVLGAILLDGAVYPEAITGLKPDDFFLSDHPIIFKRMVAMTGAGQPIDTLTLAAALAEHSELSTAHGPALLADLTDGAVKRKNVEFYVATLRKLAGWRHAMHSADAIMRQAADGGDLAAISQRFSAAAEQIAGYGIAAAGAIRKLADLPDIFTFSVEEFPELVEGLIHTGTVTLLTAPPNLRKSWLALRLAICVARGSDFLGCRCQRNAVLYLDRENPLKLIRQRMDAAAGGSIPGLHYWGAWLSEDVPMLGDHRLLAIAASEKPLMVFDSFVRFHEGDENSATEMSAVMTHLRRLANWARPC